MGNNNHAKNNSHLSFVRNKLDQQLSIKILSEEEKYVYFVRKLIEYSGFVMRQLTNFYTCYFSLLL